MFDVVFCLFQECLTYFAAILCKVDCGVMSDAKKVLFHMTWQEVGELKIDWYFISKETFFCNKEPFLVWRMVILQALNVNRHGEDYKECSETVKSDTCHIYVKTAYVYFTWDLWD